jgi:hypothetical protein
MMTVARGDPGTENLFELGHDGGHMEDGSQLMVEVEVDLEIFSGIDRRGKEVLRAPNVH